MRMEKSKLKSANYQSKEVLSNACSEIIENILKKTYEEENPFKHFEQSQQALNSKTTESATSHKNGDICSSTTDIHNKSVGKSYHNKSKRTRFRSKNSVHLPQASGNIDNPFETLLTQNDSFIFQNKNHGNFASQSNLQELIPEFDEEETDETGLSGTSEMVQTRLREYPSIYQAYFTSHSYRSTVDKINESRDQRHTSTTTNGNVDQNPIQNPVVVKPSRAGLVAYIPDNFNDILKDIQGQGDNENIENLGHSFFGSSDSISISVNFSFYAKLLAFLLTINTLIFFKTVVWTNILNFYNIK